MPLSGHSSDLSLADLVQANIYGRNTCRVLVATPEGSGVFFLTDGAIVDARFGDLVGSDAFCALVNADNAHFRVDSGIQSPARTIHQDWEGLLLEAMRLKDEHRVPAPQRPAPRSTNERFEPPTSALPGPAAVVSVRNGAAEPVPKSQPAAPISLVQTHRVVTAGADSVARHGAGAARPTPLANRGRGVWPLVAVPMLVTAGAMIAFIALGLRLRGAPVAQTTAATPAPIETFEATDLTESGDIQPRLVQGTPPRPPNTALAVAPTVVCRILIDEKGAVADAKIFRSRLELASFEDTALDAVKSYRFAPAQRGRHPVRVWVNWPVSFE